MFVEKKLLVIKTEVKINILKNLLSKAFLFAKLLILSAVFYVSADQTTIYATRYKLRIYNFAEDPGAQYGPTNQTAVPAGMYERPSGYDSEILCDFDLSAIPSSATINSVDFGYYVTTIVDGPHPVKVYKNTRAWSGVPQYDDMGLTAWPSGDLLVSETCTGTDQWHNFLSNANMKSLVEGWLASPSSNRGLVLTDAPNYWGWEISVTRVRLVIDYTANNPPTGGNDAVTTSEDINRAFQTSDFTFNDDDLGDVLEGIKIASEETDGDLEYNSSDVSANDVISNISQLVFKPYSNENGTPYASFTHWVFDGEDYSTSSYTMTINVTAVNDAPTGSDESVTTDEDVNYTFATNDFTYNDIEGSPFAGIKIISVEDAGDLEYDGSDVTANLDCPDVTKLVFKPVSNANGSPYTTFTFKVSDGSLLSTATYTMTINVTPVNDAPTGANGSVTTDEDVNITFSSGNFTYNDIDLDPFAGIRVISLETSGDLEYDGSDVTANLDCPDVTNLIFKPAAHANGSPYATFTFKVRDGTTVSSATYTMTIDVNAVNDPPSFTKGDDENIMENLGPQTVSGWATNISPGGGSDESGQALTFYVSNDNSSLFSVEPEVDSDGKLTYTSATDEFGVANCTIYLKDDGGGNDQSPDQYFIITINDVNELPNELTLTGRTVNENVSIGTEVGTFSTTDPNTWQTHTYTLESGTGDDDNALFTIAVASLQTNDAIDFETQNPPLSIRVRTTDNGTPQMWLDSVFLITVNDVNDAPTNITLTSSNVLENEAIGTTVGTLDKADQDQVDTHIYTLVAGSGDSDNVSFDINGTSLQTEAVFDYETKNRYGIRLRVTDNGGLYYEKIFNITIVNQNDPPTDITLSNNIIDENLDSGFTVGSFSTTDPDGGTHTYALVAGTGDTDNVKFSITGPSLQTTEPFDYETQNSLSIRVRSTDDGSPSASLEEVFTITVTDVNDAPTDITLSNASVSENLAAGVFVGTFSSVDQDAGDSHTYSLVAGGTDNDSFSIRPVDSLFTAAMLDFETTPTLTIRVRSTDNSGGFLEKNLIITVIDQHVAPTVTLMLPDDTLITTDSVLTLTGAATGEPGPYYKWYHYHPDSTTADSVGSGAVFTMNPTAKSDSGYFYYVAYNLAGSDTSDTMLVQVVEAVNIEMDLPTTYQAIHQGAAAFSIGVAGDGIINYQWYENGVILPGATGSSYTIDPIDSATHDGNTYYCEVWNTFSGFLLGTAKSTTCQLSVGRFYNPFKVKVESISPSNNTQVRVKLWSEIDISGFPSTVTITPWADSVWVMYKTSSYPTATVGAAVAHFSTQSIKDAAPDSLTTTLNVAPLQMPHDSCYWFGYSVLWHVPGANDTLLEPFYPANKVFLIDTLAPTNPLVVHGEYVMKTDTALVHIDSLAKLDAAKDSLLILECSKYPGFNPLMFDTTMTVPALIAVGNSLTLTLDSIGTLPLALDTVYCRWYIKGTNSADGALSDTLFTIGWPRPVYTGALFADSTKFGGQIHISWDPPSFIADSIRVWWDSDTIPLDHTFLLPQSQSKGIAPLVTIDTIGGLDNDKRYCVGLQVLKDELWSRVTDRSRAWAKTALGDTTIVDNIISIDTSWFEDSTNSIVIQWHIDTLEAPGGRTYEFGYIFSLDAATSIDTLQTITNWTPVTEKVNVTKITLFPDIVFDTTYAVGLWLRGFSVALGPGKKSPPTDTSLAFVKTPPFTWETVTIFPIDIDTIWVANQMIFIKKIEQFTIVNTITSFNPGTLPLGFVTVGGVFIQFSIPNTEIPAFILGLKYDSLPPGITEDDLGLYQYKNGQLYVMHGFQVSDSMVWDTVTNADLAYPFLILADTLSPVIYGLENNSDTIITITNIPTWFSISDNVANVYWQFRYGPGHEGYRYGKDGFLNSCVDTTLRVVIKDTLNVINDTTGLRVIIVADDGVNNDTTNVSRCIKSDSGEVIDILSNEWVPLRTTAHLDDPELETVFAKSISSEWEYDIYEYRLYRWHNTDTSNTLTPNTWIEYADSVKEDFAFVPGRLIWCKTAEEQAINFGSGVTMSLKQPYEIELKPKNWTDLSLPFKFPIMLRDILDATGITESDSLEIYHWVKSEEIYEATYVYIASIDSLQDVSDSVLVAQQKYDGYTVYNYSSSSIALRIPPVSLPLSQYLPDTLAEKRSKVKKRKDSWDIRFTWALDNRGRESFFRRVRCGYKKSSLKEARFGFLPPTMSKVHVGVLDNSGDKLSGWCLQPSLKKGGIAFEIKIRNNSDKRVKIKYYLDNLEVLPKGYSAKVLNPKNHKYEDCTKDNLSTIKVSSNSSAERIVVIGTKAYLENMITAFLPMKLLKAYPNPFSGRVKIHYRIPVGMKEVRFTLYNLRGQMLWQGIQRKNLTAGEHIYFFNGRTGLKRGVLPAGVYIMRLTAKNKAGKNIYGGRRRITCIK